MRKNSHYFISNIHRLMKNLFEKKSGCFLKPFPISLYLFSSSCTHRHTYRYTDTHKEHSLSSVQIEDTKAVRDRWETVCSNLQSLEILSSFPMLKTIKECQTSIKECQTSSLCSPHCRVNIKKWVEGKK